MRQPRLSSLLRSFARDFGHEALQVREPGAEQASRDRVAAAGGDQLVIDVDVELAGPAGDDIGFETEAFFDEGDETRRLGLGALSSGAGDDTNVHRASLLPVDHSTVPSSAAGTRANHPASGRFP